MKELTEMTFWPSVTSNYLSGHTHIVRYIYGYAFNVHAKNLIPGFLGLAVMASWKDV